MTSRQQITGHAAKTIDIVRGLDGSWVLRNRKLGTTYGPRFQTQEEATKAMVEENKRLDLYLQGR